MNDNNRLMYLTLSKVCDIETSKVSMWSLTNRHAHPPFFRFRFKGISQDHLYYRMLSEIISKFDKGHLRWSVSGDFDINPNKIILPNIFLSYFDSGIFFDKDNFISRMGEQMYSTSIEQAIEDIPQLCSFITTQWKEDDKVM